MQRTGAASTGAVLYEGIPEADYPAWTVDWMTAVEPKLAEDGSVLIIIRPHLRRGQISDYVLRTRLAVREAGWTECEELIWFKPDGPPLGSYYRPRRTWESILWFSRSHEPYKDLFACGNANSTRTGGFQGSDRFGEGSTSPIAKGQVRKLTKGTSRVTDVFTAYIANIEKGIMHPAMFPTTLSDQLIQTFSAPGDAVLDPFIGSGTTAVSARRLGRHYFGIDLNPDYVAEAEKRLG